MACMNTEFIRMCVEADSRIRTVMVSIRYWAAIYGLSGTYFKGTRILGLTHISYSASMSMLWFDTLFRGVFRTFELRVLTVIDCPKIEGAKGQLISK